MHHGERPHIEIRKMHDKMGPNWSKSTLTEGDVVLLQPNNASVCNIDALVPLYPHGSRCNEGDHYRRRLLIARHLLERRRTNPLPVMANSSNQSRHTYLKRLISPRHNGRGTFHGYHFNICSVFYIGEPEHLGLVIG